MTTEQWNKPDSSAKAVGVVKKFSSIGLTIREAGPSVLLILAVTELQKHVEWHPHLDV